MAKDLVSSAADSLLKETLAILTGGGSDSAKVENAIDHLKLGLMARKLAAKRQGAKAAPAEKPALAKTSTPTVSATPKVDTVVAAQANGSAEKTKSGMFGR